MSPCTLPGQQPASESLTVWSQGKVDAVLSLEFVSENEQSLIGLFQAQSVGVHQFKRVSTGLDDPERRLVGIVVDSQGSQNNGGAPQYRQHLKDVEEHDYAGFTMR